MNCGTLIDSDLGFRMSGFPGALGMHDLAGLLGFRAWGLRAGSWG